MLYLNRKYQQLKPSQMTTTSVLSTEELVRVTFKDGYSEVLMKQYYSDSEPFYYITKGGCLTRIETSSNDINNIIAQLKHEYLIDRSALGIGYIKTNTKVREIYKYCLDKKRELILKAEAIVNK